MLMTNIETLNVIFFAEFEAIPSREKALWKGILKGENWRERKLNNGVVQNRQEH